MIMMMNYYLLLFVLWTASTGIYNIVIIMNNIVLDYLSMCNYQKDAKRCENDAKRLLRLKTIIKELLKTSTDGLSRQIMAQMDKKIQMATCILKWLCFANEWRNMEAINEKYTPYKQRQMHTDSAGVHQNRPS